MPEKMKIYNKDGSEAEVDAVDGNRYLNDPVISQEWGAKPWPKSDAKAKASTTAAPATGDGSTASGEGTSTQS